MKFSVNLPDEVAEAARAAAVAAGITQAEWARRALLAYLHPPAHPPAPSTHPPPDPLTGAAGEAEIPDPTSSEHSQAEDVAALREELARLQGTADERLERLRDAQAMLARLTPDADRPGYRVIPGPGAGLGDYLRAWWAGRSAGP